LNGIDRALTNGVKRLVMIGLATGAFLTAGHTRSSALEKLQLQVSPTVSMAPASIIIRALVEHDATNRELELVADSSEFYRRTVVELDGEFAPKVNELRINDVPGGDYEVTARLYHSDGQFTVVKRSIMVMSLSSR
jgi:hypothetical protein